MRSYLRFLNWNKTASGRLHRHNLYLSLKSNGTDGSHIFKPLSGDMYFVKNGNLKIFMEGDKGNMYLEKDLNIGGRLNINNNEDNGTILPKGIIRSSNENFDYFVQIQIQP